MEEVLNMVTGILRPIDKLGRVVIPCEYRELLGLRPGDRVEFVALHGSEEPRVYIRKYESKRKGGKS